MKGKIELYTMEIFLKLIVDRTYFLPLMRTYIRYLQEVIVKLGGISRHTYSNFLKKHKGQLKHPIIQSYLKEKEHYHLFKQAVENPSPENRKSLDDSFKRFYFKIRFKSYLSKTIHFNAINFDKKTKKFLEQNVFILDKPVKEDGTDTLIDLLMIFNNDAEETNSPKIEDHISNEKLYDAIKNLTDNQRQILSLAYVSCLNDSEIAAKLNKSQQAVSKSHKRALNKLKRFLEKNN